MLKNFLMLFKYIYAVPYEWYEKYGVRRYGYHGTSHRYIYKTICNHFGKDNLKVISCHIGNGASITAIDSGKVVDTTLGFSSLVGLIMGTRCGDIDVAIVQYMMKKTGKSIDEVMDDLYKRSGAHVPGQQGRLSRTGADPAGGKVDALFHQPGRQRVGGRFAAAVDNTRRGGRKRR